MQNLEEYDFRYKLSRLHVACTTDDQFFPGSVRAIGSKRVADSARAGGAFDPGAWMIRSKISYEINEVDTA
jgi:hypothetical protein